MEAHAMCLYAQVACQKTLHMENKQRHLSVNSSWCMTQVSEKLSRAGSTVAVATQFYLDLNKQENQVDFKINIFDVVFPLSTFPTHSQKAFSLLLNINLLSHVAKPNGHFPALILLALSSLLDLSLSSFRKQALITWLPSHLPISFASLPSSLLLSLFCLFFPIFSFNQYLLGT